MILRFVEFPIITSEGIVVKKEIGIIVLKNTLRGNENELSGNLPT